MDMMVREENMGLIGSDDGLVKSTRFCSWMMLPRYLMVTPAVLMPRPNRLRIGRPLPAKGFYLKVSIISRAFLPCLDLRIVVLAGTRRWGENPEAAWESATALYGSLNVKR